MSLSVPFSVTLQRARAGKQAPSETSTAHESDDGSSATRSHKSTPKPHEARVQRVGSQRDPKRASLQMLAPIPSQKPSPLRRRSSPSPLHPTKQPVIKKSLTKNYMHMVKDFNAMKKYAKQGNGEFLATSLCVFCETTVPRLVLFPCQHRCVCDPCLVLNDITHMPTSATSWTACPVCMADIKLMLPHSGDEEAIYWKWALQIPPTLPENFKQEFREVSNRLRRGASSVQPETVANEGLTMSKGINPPVQSPPAANAVAPVARSTRSRRSLTSSVHAVRRFSIVKRRGNEPSEANTRCTIL